MVSEIIGSQATWGESRRYSSSTPAAEEAGRRAAWDSGGLTSNSPMTGAPPPLTAPAAAAPALVSALAAPERNLLAAPARAAEFMATFGAGVALFESAAAFLLSLHFSRSSTDSPALC